MNQNSRLRLLIVMLSVIASYFLIGCTPKSKIYMESLASISRGLSRQDATRAIDAEPLMVLILEDSNEGPNSVTVEVFDMVTGTTFVSGSIYVAGFDGAPGYSIPTLTEVDVTESYFILYYRGQLEFWGFLDEFGRCDDVEIQAFRKKIDEAYQEELGRRKSLNNSEFGLEEDSL